MTLRSLVCHVATAFTLIAPLVTASPARAQSSGVNQLPAADESAIVTVVGCLQLGGEKGDKYVLGDVTVGPANSVTEQSCRTSGGVIELEHEKRFGMNESMLGRWVEINGRLEKETSDDPDNLRELHVRSFRMVPVIPPRAAAAPTYIAPPPLAAEPERMPQQQAAVTPEAPRTNLPRTATNLPSIGLAGLLMLTAAVGLRWSKFDERG
jgi:hypothetical protein